MRGLMKLSFLASALTALLLGVVVLPAHAVEIPFPALPDTQASGQSDAMVFRDVFRPEDNDTGARVGPGGRLVMDDLAPMGLASDTDSICILSGVQGRQRGRGNMRVATNGTTWQLFAHNYDGVLPSEPETPFAVGAICVPRSSFVTNPGGVVWDYPMAPQEHGSFPVDDSGCGGSNRDRRIPLGQASGPAFISQVEADLGSFSDHVTVEAPSSPLDNRTLWLRNTQCQSNHYAAATSFFIGVPGQTTFPKLAGRKTETLRATSGRGAEVSMVPTREGICGFTHLAGRWEGHLEGAWLEPQMIGGIEYWTARVNAGSAGEVEATVTCIAYDQRWNDSGSPD